MNTSIEIESSKRLRGVVPSRMRREIDIHVSCNEVLKVKPKTIIYTLQGGNEENFDLSYGAAPTQDEVAFSAHATIRDEISVAGGTLADLSHRRRICSGVVQETADQPSTVVDVSPVVASAQPRRRFPPPSRLLPGTVASQPSLLPRSTGEKVDTDLQLRSLARLNGEAVTPTGSGSVYSLFSALMGGVVGVVVWFSGVVGNKVDSGEGLSSVNNGVVIFQQQRSPKRGLAASTVEQ
nr:uncharacterized protein LOC109175453 [Ipomoea batatas]